MPSVTTTRAALLSAAATAAALLVVIGMLATGLKLFGDGLGRDELWSECSYDATASGQQGWCVVVARYPGTPVHSPRTYLEIAPVHDGQPSTYRFVAAYPFYDGRAGDRLDVDWTAADRQITVEDPATGARITYTAEQYAGGR